MKQPIKVMNSLDDIEIQFFDEDPDGAEDRAGDGYYYRILGEDGWSGCWHSEDEAMDEALDDLRRQERKAIAEEAMEDGCLCVRNDETILEFVNKIDDRWFTILVNMEHYHVRAMEVFPSGGRTKLLDTDDERVLPERMEGEEEFGHLQGAVRVALERIGEHVSPTMSM
ncbi:hypothetical protein D3C71_156480 [compost metagenome]